MCFHVCGNFNILNSITILLPLSDDIYSVNQSKWPIEDWLWEHRHHGEYMRAHGTAWYSSFLGWIPWINPTWVHMALLQGYVTLLEICSGCILSCLSWGWRREKRPHCSCSGAFWRHTKGLKIESIIEWFGLEETFKDHLIHPPARNRNTLYQIRLPGDPVSPGLNT